MVFGDRAFGKLLGHEGGALMKGISTLIKGTTDSFLAPSPSVRLQREATIYEPGSRASPDTKYASALILDFLPPRTVKK